MASSNSAAVAKVQAAERKEAELNVVSINPAARAKALKMAAADFNRGIQAVEDGAQRTAFGSSVICAAICTMVESGAFNDLPDTKGGFHIPRSIVVNSEERTTFTKSVCEAVGFTYNDATSSQRNALRNAVTVAHMATSLHLLKRSAKMPEGINPKGEFIFDASHEIVQKMSGWREGLETHVVSFSEALRRARVYAKVDGDSKSEIARTAERLATLLQKMLDSDKRWLDLPTEDRQALNKVATLNNKIKEPVAAGANKPKAERKSA